MTGLNQWQQYFINVCYNGKVPRSQIGSRKLALLGQVKNMIKVDFPDFNGINGFEPAHSETYNVTLDQCNMPAGLISVDVLASNLVLWMQRGYKVATM